MRDKVPRIDANRHQRRGRRAEGIFCRSKGVAGCRGAAEFGAGISWNGTMTRLARVARDVTRGMSSALLLVDRLSAAAAGDRTSAVVSPTSGHANCASADSSISEGDYRFGFAFGVRSLIGDDAIDANGISVCEKYATAIPTVNAPACCGTANQSQIHL